MILEKKKHFPMTEYSAYCFDFDGVLVDSVALKAKAFAILFESYGKEVVKEVVDHHHGHGGVTRREKFRYYHETYLNRHLDEHTLDKLCQRFSSLVVDEVVAAPEIPGAEAFLKECYEKVPCFIVSATPDEELREIVIRRRLAPYFREVLGSSRSKQENLVYLFHKYDFQPERCLFFGDAESDYRAALTCKANFFGILPGPNAPLLKAVPDIRWAPDFTEINP